MTTEILTNEYLNGKRVTTQKITYMRADDLQTLGQLQISLARVLAAIESLPVGQPGAQYADERARLAAAITAQQKIVDAYDSDSA